ncbi:unnamed protein product [Closterium sp. Yama58-4]|nr:unnamed protein product [Closterium sp. Yama58-4]
MSITEGGNGAAIAASGTVAAGGSDGGGSSDVAVAVTDTAIGSDGSSTHSGSEQGSRSSTHAKPLTAAAPLLSLLTAMGVQVWKEREEGSEGSGWTVGVKEREAEGSTGGAATCQAGIGADGGREWWGWRCGVAAGIDAACEGVWRLGVRSWGEMGLWHPKRWPYRHAMHLITPNGCTIREGKRGTPAAGHSEPAKMAEKLGAYWSNMLVCNSAAGIRLECFRSAQPSKPHQLCYQTRTRLIEACHLRRLLRRLKSHLSCPRPVLQLPSAIML